MISSQAMRAISKRLIAKHAGFVNSAQRFWYTTLRNIILQRTYFPLYTMISKGNMVLLGHRKMNKMLGRTLGRTFLVEVLHLLQVMNE
jgi:hypothetical protein